MLEELKSLDITAAALFNAYQDWFNRLHKSNKELDIDIKFRLRAFGNDDLKQLRYREEWAIDRGWKGKCPAGLHISSTIPEIWCDLKESKDGHIILPPHVLAHEVMHEIYNLSHRTVYPDDLVKGIY
ncbi:MAG: hypothetical protein HQK79_14140 [Desulfobacterales bacterium]|nr:hypothetical protein [Desulfobacterales bacterium]